MKIIKVILMIVFFPFTITYFGWKKKNKPLLALGIALIFCTLLFGSMDDETPNVDQIAEEPSVEINEKSEANAANNEIVEETNINSNDTQVEQADNIETESTNTEPKQVIKEELDEKSFEGYKKLEVDGGDLSGDREPNVVVDIGFGDREYYAFTNEHSQLVKVIADKITLQDESKEPVTSKGRYYPDEAKVPGTESKTLDEGHVIADSLGGVANAYNITPQDSTLNRHGDQAYMEKVIRQAGGCTDFVAVITYPDNNTQIPSHYSYTYTINGQIVNDEFDNGNPDIANEEIIKKQKEADTKQPKNETSNVEGGIEIVNLDKKAEIIVIKNTSDQPVNLSGWRILSVLGGQDFIFSDFTLQPGATVTVGDSAKNNVDFHWLEGRGVWNNSKHDPAELYNSSGALIDSY